MAHRTCSQIEVNFQSKIYYCLGLFLLFLLEMVIFYHFNSSLVVVSQTYNPHPECPPTSDHIWVFSDNNGDGANAIVNIPFEDGYDTTDADGAGSDTATGHINYVTGVLLGEVSPTFNTVEQESVVFNDEFLSGFVMLVRTVAIQNCGEQIEEGHPAIDARMKQRYIPSPTANDPDTTNRHLSAVAATAGEFVTDDEGQIFDAQYRDISRSPTNGQDDIHPSVFGPAGIPHTHSPSKTGLPQINANHSVAGITHGHYLPRWNLCHMLAHYYSGITFNCPYTTLPTPTDYRFTVLTTTVTDKIGEHPPLWQRGSWQEIGLVLQNSGSEPWILTPQDKCNPSHYDERTIALAIHWYEADGSLAEFEGNRTPLCTETVNGLQRAQVNRGEIYPTPQDDVTYTPVIIWGPTALSAGLYEIWLDLELLPLHPLMWVSRLHPDTNPTQPVWSPQPLRVRVSSGSANPPEGPFVSLPDGPQPGQWSNIALVRLSWPPQAGVTTYAYTWRHGFEVEAWQETDQTSLEIILPDGEHTFHLQALGDDGTASDIVSVGPFLIDTNPPIATLFPLPAIITDPFRMDVNLAWHGIDAGGRGLYFDVAYTVQPIADEPPPIPLKAQIMQTTTDRLSLTDLGLTLQEEYTYHFWVRAHNGAGNLSPWQYGEIRYQPVPVLQVEPNHIRRYRLFSDTPPFTTTLSINNPGGGVLTWTTTSPVNWLTVSPVEGATSSTVVITITLPLTTLNQTTFLPITAPDGTLNSPYQVGVDIYSIPQWPAIYLPWLSKWLFVALKTIE